MRKSWLSVISLSMAFAFMLSFHTVAFAASYSVHLSGSGPVYTSAFKPGARTITVSVETYNNLNVGYDVIDQGDGKVIANGTVKNKGTRTVKATSHSGHTYKFRLRCQEPVWNNTKVPGKERLAGK